jgi:hypothetical protein
MKREAKTSSVSKKTPTKYTRRDLWEFLVNHEKDLFASIGVDFSQVPSIAVSLYKKASESIHEYPCAEGLSLVAEEFTVEEQRLLKVIADNLQVNITFIQEIFPL